MDGFINSSIEKQTIYEIYRACRLCGAGAGYKMPIMQNVVHLDGAEVELKQKIRECVQIEVHQEDKMPPLICELCVDKVNDFYEFLEMCRQTNKCTRLRLGLPQTMPRGVPDAADCILGVTEPVFLNEDSNESLLKPRRKKGRFTKESNTTKKIKSKQNEVRSLRSQQASPPPRASKRSREEDMALSKLQKTSTRRSVAVPKSVPRKDIEVKVEEEWSPTRSKRSRDSRDSKPDVIKRVKIVEKPIPKTSPKSDFNCKMCKSQFNNNKALNNHMRVHNRTQPKYKNTTTQEKKISCTKCKKDFSTKLSLDRHKCTKSRSNKCSNCGRHISNARNLANHERACHSRKEFKISPKLLKQLRPIQIRLQRCDQLLKKDGESYNVSAVDCNFGLDKNCFYPYLTSLSIKTEPSYMVNIHNTIDEFDLNQDYVHWDSDSSESDLEISDLKEKSVGTLASLSLRTIFSHKFLGKVPKRKRRVKPDKAYDSILNFDSDVRFGINNIINSLDTNRPVNDTKDNDNDSLFGENKTPAVSNDDFDSLFSSNNDSESNTNNKRETDDGKCENDGSENINEMNNDSVIELNSNDIKKIQGNDKDECEGLDIVNNSDVNKDKLIIKKETEDSLFSNNTIEDNDVKENKEPEQTDKVIKSNDNEIEKTTSIINDNNQEINVNERDVFNDEAQTDLSEYNNVDINDLGNKSNDVPLNKTDNDLEKSTAHVNGDDKMDLDDLKDISDSEIDDNRLMEAIDEQIGEKTDHKSQDTITVVKSADLESVLSEKL